eukprot:CAMPEP_0196793434 /NCGR_PEP_ID=MMETSP1104-20130614/32974_1 /TAXON_ID=33652 /ORGANISM="Cafeteria sp., Strain Caron Lab Isolate" /LENGTH=44 /DNA_ID= /DNA_START= /DNA_END= /DNA_ORIENTATION=
MERKEDQDRASNFQSEPSYDDDLAPGRSGAERNSSGRQAELRLL